MAIIKFGDRVRVTFEGKWTGRAADTESVTFIDGTNVPTPTRTNVTVEKIEPPVEVFKPGDTVRDRNARDYIFTIGRSGYFDHHNALWNSGDHEPFTSKEFERVSLDSGA